MNAAKVYLFAGGGTGGHLFPGIAIADELRKRDALTRFVFVGSSRAIESSIVAQHHLEHRSLPVESLATLKSNPMKFASRNWQAWKAAKRLLLELRPSAIIGLGGYASAPIVWGAHRQKIPVILLEQNVIPGRTTRWLSRFSTCVCVSFSETGHHLKRARHVIVTGNPVRAEIAALFDRPPAETSVGLVSAQVPELLILGGSQGADSLNDVVLGAIKKNVAALRNWRIVHQTGPRQTNEFRCRYQELGLQSIVEPFFHDLPSRYASATLVISRAGATTLSELACAGRAMILFPYPHASDNHQRANALAFVASEAAIMLEHSSSIEQTSNALSIPFQRLIEDIESRQAMSQASLKLAHPNAATEIANIIEEAVSNHFA